MSLTINNHNHTSNLTCNCDHDHKHILTSYRDHRHIKQLYDVVKSISAWWKQCVLVFSIIFGSISSPSNEKVVISTAVILPKIYIV